MFVEENRVVPATAENPDAPQVGTDTRTWVDVVKKQPEASTSGPAHSVKLRKFNRTR